MFRTLTNLPQQALAATLLAAAAVAQLPKPVNPPPWWGVADNDTVIGTVLTTGNDELILVSHQGLAVRFRERDPETGEENFRATGRATGGVTGMRFKLDSDHLDVIEVVDHTAKFLVASEAGLGVRTRFEDYRLINRGGSGVWARSR